MVITIIVLLILAGVTISTLTGDNGLLQKSTNAKQANESANIEEQIKLAIAEAQVSKYVNTGKTEIDTIRESIENALNETINVEKVGSSVKIIFVNSDKIYKYYANGDVKKIIPLTQNLYGKLDENEKNIIFKSN